MFHSYLSSELIQNNVNQMLLKMKIIILIFKKEKGLIINLI